MDVGKEFDLWAATGEMNYGAGHLKQPRIDG